VPALTTPATPAMLPDLLAAILPGLVLLAAGLALAAGCGLSPRALRRAAWLLPLLILLPFLLCLFWIHPQADDWSVAISGREGWLRAQAAWYQNWSARYTATALLSAWPVFGDWLLNYRLLAVAVFALSYLAIERGLWVLAPEALAPVQRRLLALGVLALQAATAASPAAQWYWLAAALTYQLGAALLLLALAAARGSERSGGATRAVLAVLAVLGAVAAAGCSELTALLARSFARLDEPVG